MRKYILYNTVVGPKHSVLSMLFQVIALCCYCLFFLAQHGLDKYTLELLIQMQDIHCEPTITEKIYLFPDQIKFTNLFSMGIRYDPCNRQW